MVGGRGGVGWLVKKLRVRGIGGKKKKGKKSEENYIKKQGKKALKVHSFGLYTPKNWISKERGMGNDQNQYIPPGLGVSIFTEKYKPRE